MSLSIGELVGYVSLDTDGVDKGLRRVEGDTMSMGKRMSSGLKSLIGPAALAAGGMALGSFFKDAFGEAQEAAKVGAQTEAVIKSTGAASNVTAEQVGDLAAAISAKTGIDDEAIQSGQNMLLTFKNLRNETGAGNDMFNQATSIMTDMSAAMGTDAKSSAIMLGKALNDPTKGLTALSRVGITFSESQTKQIKAMQKSGDMMGAQKVIMAELESQFGGTAEAIATPADKAAVAWGNFKEAAGTALMPVINKTLNTVTAVALALTANLQPALQSAGDVVSSVTGFLSEHETIAKAVGIAITAFLVPGLIIMGVEATKSAALSVAAWVSQQVAAAKSVAVFVVSKTAMVAGWALMGVRAMAGAAKVAASWLIAMGPVGLVIAAVVGLVALIVKNWDTIKDATKRAWEWVSGKVGDTWDWIKTKTTNGISAVVEWVRELPGKFVNGLSSLRDKVGDVFRTAMEWGKDKVTGIGGTILEWIRAIPGKIGELGSKMGEAGRELLQRFIDGMKNAAGIIAGIAGNVWNTVRGLLNGAIDRINGALEFTIDLPGPKNLTVDLPNIPHLATGGRATGAQLAVIGEGREPESVLPDSVLRGLLERAHAAGAAAAGDSGGRSAPLIGKVVQAPGESADTLAERLWFKTRTRG